MSDWILPVVLAAQAVFHVLFYRWGRRRGIAGERRRLAGLRFARDTPARRPQRCGCAVCRVCS